MQWAYQTQGRNITRIKFLFWNDSQLKLIRLALQSAGSYKTSFHQPVLWRKSREEPCISSEADSKRDPGELPLLTYGQTLPTFMDERYKNLPPELGKHSSTQKAENIALKMKKKRFGKELLAGKAILSSWLRAQPLLWNWMTLNPGPSTSRWGWAGFNLSEHLFSPICTVSKDTQSTCLSDLF